MRNSPARCRPLRTGQEKQRRPARSESILKVKNDAAIFPFGLDERFQFGNVLFVHSAA